MQYCQDALMTSQTFPETADKCESKYAAQTTMKAQPYNEVV